MRTSARMSNSITIIAPVIEILMATGRKRHDDGGERKDERDWIQAAIMRWLGCEEGVRRAGECEGRTLPSSWSVTKDHGGEQEYGFGLRLCDSYEARRSEKSVGTWGHARMSESITFIHVIENPYRDLGEKSAITGEREDGKEWTRGCGYAMTRMRGVSEKSRRAGKCERMRKGARMRESVTILVIAKLTWSGTNEREEGKEWTRACDNATRGVWKKRECHKSRRECDGMTTSTTMSERISVILLVIEILIVATARAWGRVRV
jgi:hypothetical protein